MPTKTPAVNNAQAKAKGKVVETEGEVLVAAQADSALPAAKRHRSQAEDKPTLRRSARRRQPLFVPYRALGFITNAVPFLLQVRRGGKDASKPDVNVVTCLGNSWAMWNAEEMRLLFVGPPLESPITSMALSESPDSVLAASGSAVYRYVRGKEVARYDPVTSSTVNDSDSDTDSASSSSSSSSSVPSAAETLLSQIIVFGDNLLALSASGRQLFLWSIMSSSLEATIELPESFLATSILHPATYLNKVLVGGTNGEVKLYNIRTGTCLHTFDGPAIHSTALGELGLAADVSVSHKDSAITSLSQTPAVDVIALGFSDGVVALHNTRTDETVLCVSIKGGLAPGTGALSFRTDGRAHTMAVASRNGDIAVFDLDAELPSDGMEQDEDDEDAAGVKRGVRLVHTIRSAHEAAVGCVAFVPTQPILLSTAGDNALRQWFFEGTTTSAAPRLLKSREGHAAPPHLIRFYGEHGRDILSASTDRSIRCISTIRDARSFELSQGSLIKRARQLGAKVVDLKLARTTSIAYSLTRSRDWDDVLTTHAGGVDARSWTVRDKRMGRVLAATPARQEGEGPASHNEATTCAVSPCGNFGLVGTHVGTVQMYNMQSGMWRRTFDTRPIVVEGEKGKKIKGKAKKEKRGMGSPVTGIVVDPLITNCIVATLDGRLSFFNFRTATLEHTQRYTNITSLHLHSDTSLLALLSDQLLVRLVDISTRRLVRTFTGFRARVTDAAFSHDGRWLLVSSAEGIVRTFDVPSARLVDAFRTPSTPVSLCVSPVGDFLATAHAGSVGVYLWANRAALGEVPLRGMDESDVDELLTHEDASAIMPHAAGGQSRLDERAYDDESELASDDEVYAPFTSAPQLGDGDERLMTLSHHEPSRWATLLHLDLIKARNRPTEKPKAPEKAPFFLPQIAGVDGKFEVGKTVGSGERKEKGKGFFEGKVEVESEVERRLRIVREGGDANQLFLYLDSLPVPALDASLRSLEHTEDLCTFLRACASRLRARKDLDAVQAMLGVFLRAHAEELEGGPADVSEDFPKADIDMDIDGVGGGEENDEGKKELKRALEDVLSAQHREVESVMDRLDYCLGTLAFVRNLPLT